MKDIIYGSVEVVNIHLDPYHEMHMDDYDFDVEFSVRGSIRKHTVTKQDMVRIDADNYEARCDTRRIGRGQLEVIATALIPDSNMADGYRPVMACLTDDLDPINIR